MKKSDHSKLFVERMDKSGKNQDKAKESSAKALAWVKASTTKVKTVGGLVAAFDAVIVAATATDASYSSIVTQMIALEDKIEPLENSDDKDDQKKLKKLMADYKKLASQADKTYKLMHKHVDQLNKNWHAIDSASQLPSAFGK